MQISLDGKNANLAGLNLTLLTMRRVRKHEQTFTGMYKFQ